MTKDYCYVIAVARMKNGRGVIRFKTPNGEVANAYDSSVVTYTDMESARLSITAANQCIVRRATARTKPVIQGYTYYMCESIGDRGCGESIGDRGCGEVCRIYLTEYVGKYNGTGMPKQYFPLPLVIKCPRCGRWMRTDGAITSFSGPSPLVDGSWYFDAPNMAEHKAGIKHAVLHVWNDASGGVAL